MAIVFKRLPGVTFRGMLIRPQSSTGPRRASLMWTDWPARAYQVADAGSLASLNSVAFKMISSLHMLLITTDLHQPAPPPLPPSSSLFLALAWLSFHRKWTWPKLLWPSAVAGNQPKAERDGGGRHRRWAGIKYMPLFIAIVLSSLKWGEKDQSFAIQFLMARTM